MEGGPFRISRAAAFCFEALLIATLGIAPAPGTAARTDHVRGDDVRAAIVEGADSLDAALGSLSAAFARGLSNPTDVARVRAAFRLARVRYKHVEGALEFYSPALAAAFNSRRQEVDDEDAPPPSTLSPRGFPAIEGFVWPTPVASRADSARRLVDAMRRDVSKLRALAMAIRPSDAQVIELTRLELVRVSTLGIAGFDAPLTGEGILECADALDGIRTIFAAAGPRWPAQVVERRALESTLVAASAYLRSHHDFEAFDRLEYLSAYGEPAARALDALRRAVVRTPLEMPRPLRADAPSPYTQGAFDPAAYAPRNAPRPSPELLALGRRLFSDPSLSSTGTRSCASCHRPELAFSDGLSRAASLNPRVRVERNTPTLVNAALQPAQFADERAVTLEDQIVSVMASPAEMGTGNSVERAAKVLGATASYRNQFGRAFDAPESGAVTPLRVRQALAAYVRSLVALDSRFDRAVRGDPAALSGEERRGFNLFMGKARCGTCHFAPLFSGVTPPLYERTDVEVIGTSVSPEHPGILDADLGRARIDHLPEHVAAFKTPTLRNVALTAPYMHHGAFRTLDEVLRFYDAGGGQGAGARLTNQTLPADSLHLSASERSAIEAFLRSLTDTSGLGRRG